jgi:nucleoside-diphosphate-sugar epimerase
MTAGAPTVLVTGGTGQLGVFLIPRLLAAGCRVIALSRRVRPDDPQNPAAGEGRLSWLHPRAFPARPAGGGGETPVDALISAGPVGLAAALLAQCPRLGSLVCFSTSSVQVKADSPAPAERAVIDSIVAAERELMHACSERSIPLWLLRPTLIYGCGLDRNVSRIARIARRIRFIPVAGPARGLRQPVHADDLAALAVRAISPQAANGMESAVAGGETLSYREMVVRVFAAFGLRPRLLTLPPRLLAGAASVAGWLIRAEGLNAQVVLRQNRDLVFDDAAVRARLAHEPRPFRPTAADFAVPVTARALQPR